MYVALCDDDSFIIDKLRKLLLEYAKQNRVAMWVDSYSDGRSLLDSPRNYDFIILDYEMGEINGLQTAQTLRQRNSISTIVFLTSYPQFMVDAFEVNTFRFLLKPVDKEKLFKALDDYVRVARSNYPITLVLNKELVKIQSDAICYIEADGKYSNIHLSNTVMHCSKTLAGVTQLLPEYCFVKTHRSYVVNMHYIKSYTTDTVYLTNNEVAYMSKTYYKPFQSAFMNFLDKYYVRL